MKRSGYTDREDRVHGEKAEAWLPGLDSNRHPSGELPDSSFSPERLLRGIRLADR